MSDRPRVREQLPDPRQVGPLDLAALAVDRARSWLHTWRHYVAGLVLVVVAAQVAVFLDSGTVFLKPPSLPNWLLVILLPAPFVLAAGAVLGAVGTAKVDRNNTVLLSALTGDDGEQKLVHVSRDTWADMRVVSQNGTTKGRDYLQTVTVNGTMAYEVDDYWRDGNIAIASSMAGRTDKQLRQDRHDIARAKSELEQENDRMWDALVSHNDHVREHAATVGNHLIRTVEGVRVPGGESLYDDLQQSLEEGPDLVEQLELDDYDPDADDREHDDGDGRAVPQQLDDSEQLVGIFQEAAQQEQAATDGGTEK